MFLKGFIIILFRSRAVSTIWLTIQLPCTKNGEHRNKKIEDKLCDARFVAIPQLFMKCIFPGDADLTNILLTYKNTYCECCSTLSMTFKTRNKSRYKEFFNLLIQIFIVQAVVSNSKVKRFI